MSDLIVEGFKKLDVPDITHPPKIKWGQAYLDMSDERKINYLEKLASSMNHAASLLQDERNKLGELCEKKEQQIQKLTVALAQNNFMIQEQITKHNADKQEYLSTISKQNTKIKELEKSLGV